MRKSRSAAAVARPIAAPATHRTRSTTVLCVRRNDKVVMAGDGQVTLGESVIKHGAKKIRRLYQDKILAGFAGSTADAFTLFSRFEANTLTGSIGVISEFPEASQLMKNLGVTVAVIKSGAVKDMGSLYRPMTDEEQALWQKVIDETYGSFVQIVADGRHMPADKVRALADGRVFTGRQALALGLVDALGYEEDALAKAAALGGIKGTPRVIHLAPPAFSFLSALLSGQISQSLLPGNFLSDLLAPKLEYRWTGQ
jgi:hypothetical protein